MPALFQEELLNQTVTGSVTGAAFNTPDVTMLDVTVLMTYVSGSTFSYSVYLDGSSDGGTTWHPLIEDSGYDNGAAVVTARQHIVSAYLTAVTQTAGGLYKHLGVSKIRPRVVLNSGTGSFTIKILASGK